MAKSFHQKLKLLVLADFLLKETDEEHPVSVSDLIAHLESCGIKAERKSIYSDLEELGLFGLDIVKQRGGGVRYFIGERDFELPELHLLVDAVQSSRFITQKKSEALIKKLQGLASRHQAKSFSRSVFVAGRIKSMNESVYRLIDALSSAIDQNRAVSFQYFDRNSRGERIYHRSGALYTVSPGFLHWDDEYYYLVGVEENSGAIRHFRVDKIASLSITDAPRFGENILRDFDVASFERKTFGMFGGKEEQVTLRATESLAGVFFDRFGDSLLMRRAPGGFETTVSVVTSPTFYAWLSTFGNRVKILSPEWVQNEYRDLIDQIRALYDKEEDK